MTYKDHHQYRGLRGRSAVLRPGQPLIGKQKTHGLTTAQINEFYAAIDAVRKQRL